MADRERAELCYLTLRAAAAWCSYAERSHLSEPELWRAQSVARKLADRSAELAVGICGDRCPYTSTCLALKKMAGMGRPADTDRRAAHAAGATIG
jgi:hypothetical protein